MAYMPESHYYISTNELKGSFKNSSDALNLSANELVRMVRSGEIWFPYQRTFQSPPEVLFENLRKITVQTQIQEYELRSYNPKFNSYKPPKFRGKPTLLLTIRDAYEKADVLSDYFIEEVRLRAKRYDQQYSTEECWFRDDCLHQVMLNALKNEYITPVTLREAMYNTIAETGTFSPSWARGLIQLVMGNETQTADELNTMMAGKKWLDISSGWGDRLLAAMSLGMDYVGFDPNIELKSGHSNMISMFGDPSRHRVIYEPFEKGTIPEGPYDVVLTSPPYFTVEEYVPNQEGQSIVSFPEKTQWIVWFLYASLSKAWDNLKENGYLILHLGDSVKKDKNGKIIQTIDTTEAANIFIENYLEGSSWEGIIGIKGRSGYARPVWVWKKVGPFVPRVLWEPEGDFRRKSSIRKSSARPPLPSKDRTLLNTYEELQRELINFYAAKYAPYYSIRTNNCRIIRDHVKLRLASYSEDIINRILNDCLLISSLLETIGIEETINQCMNIVTSVSPILRSDENAIVRHHFEIGDTFAPNFRIRKQNGIAIRDYIKIMFPYSYHNIIDSLLQNDLLLSSLLEVLGERETIKWGIIMMSLAFPS